MNRQDDQNEGRGELRRPSEKEQELLTEAVETVIFAIKHNVLPDVRHDSDLLVPNGVQQRLLHNTYIQEDATNTNPWAIGLVAGGMVVALNARRHPINWPDRFMPSLADVAGLVFLSSLRDWRLVIRRMRTGNPEAPIWDRDIVIWRGAICALRP